jgi:mannose-6-phosphate isomerase-like protein (cupin superfamily)
VSDQSAGAVAKGTRRAAIKIYFAADAVDNGTTGFRGEGWASPTTSENMQELYAAGHMAGVQSSLLFRQTPEEGGFSAVIVWGKPNYPLARHSHRSDCMYFIISGSASLGNVNLRPGDSFYAPDGAPYAWTAGPDGVEILEVRHGVELIGTDMSEMSAETAARHRRLIEENRDRWAEMDVSPTFAANQQR